MKSFSQHHYNILSPLLLQLSLKEHDEKQLFYARQHLIDLRNVYAVLTDLIHKNISKVIAVYAGLEIILNSSNRYGLPKPTTALASTRFCDHDTYTFAALWYPNTPM